jgi:SAM-dependent methyltransferase
MADPRSGWSESTSGAFIELADIAVPSRDEQMEVMLSLVPATTEREFRAAELACGDGRLSAALLERFPRAQVLALDRSALMLDRARERLEPFAERAQVREFDIDRTDWLSSLPSPLRCVLSSLAIHHLDNSDKRRLFREVASRLEPGGALLIADVVAPASDVVRSAQIAAWHRTAREQSLALTDGLETYERAVAEGWGPEAEPDPLDRPWRLFEQLKWIEEAGFSTVDCFWMRAGIAVYGGYR